jgi:hypothetical protein
MLAPITCRHAHRLMSERMDRVLSTAEAVRLCKHLRACGWCRRVDGQLVALRAAMRRIGR